jgi:hypothetical protein
MNNPRSFILSIILLFLTATQASPQPGSASAQNSINENTLKSRLIFLSSAWFEGRKTGEHGNDLAADYLKSIYREIGLEQMQSINKEPYDPDYFINGYQGYFQKIPLFRYNVPPVDPLKVITQSDQGMMTEEFDYGGDYLYFNGYTSRSFSGRFPVLLAGYGITDSATGYNDYKDLDVRGKAVLILVGYPGVIDTLSPAYKKMHDHILLESQEYDKYKKAIKMGAAAVLFYHSTSRWPMTIRGNNRIFELETENSQTSNMLEIVDDSDSREVPFVIVNHPLAHHLLNGTGIDLNAYETEIAMTCKPSPVFLKNKEIEISIRKNKEFIFSNNIIGYIPGKKTDEYVIVGAHYDHVGKGTGGICYGADDNASGVAAVLSIARACKEMHVQPEKSILFALWTGEENGLLGSEYFLKKWNNGKIDSYFNFDMVSRYNPNDSANFLQVFHSNDFPKVTDLINTVNITDSLNLKILYVGEEGDIPGSDHKPFALKKIPFCWFFTGFHDDYHEESDTFDKANIEDMTRIVDLGFRMVLERAGRVD